MATIELSNKNERIPVLIAGNRMLRASLFLLLLLATFALYLYDIEVQSFWRDEALSVLRARQPWSDQWRNLNVIDGAAGPDLHPPLYFICLKIWTLFLGESEFALRLFSTFSQLVAIIVLARLGHELKGKTGTLFVLALSPFLWWYAQETRMYALLFLMGNLCLLLLWRLLKEAQPTRWQYLRLFGLTLAATAVHYTGAFLLGFIVLILLWQRQRRLGSLALGVGMLFLVGVVSLATLDGRLFDLGLSGLGPANWWRILNESLRTFSFGSSQTNFDVGWELLPFLLLIGAAFWGSWTSWRRNRAWMHAAFTVVGLVVMSLIFYVGGVIQVEFANPRHYTLMAPFWFLSLGFGFAVFWAWNRPATLLLALIIAYVGIRNLDQAINHPPQIRDDMRALVAYLEPRLQAGDAIVVHDAAMMAIYEIYALPEVPARAIPASYMTDDGEIRQLFDDFTADHDRIWFVSGLSGPTGVSNRLELSWVTQETVSFDAAWSGLHLSLHTRALEDGEVPADLITVSESLTIGTFTLQGILAEAAPNQEKGSWWTLYWENPAGSEQPGDANTCLRLTDSQGTVWSQHCQQMFRQRGNVGQSVFRRQFWLKYPEGLPPSTYDVTLIIPGKEYTVSTLNIAPSEASSDRSPLAAGAGADLLAVKWEAATFRAGNWALGQLIWRANGTQTDAIEVNLRLVDWLGREAFMTAIPLGPPNYPASEWHSGQLVNQPFGFELPFALEGTYRLQIQFPDSNWETVAETSVEGWPRLTDLPEDVTASAQTYRFDERIELVAAESNRVGDQLDLTFYWRSPEPIEANYVVFVHIAPAGQPPLAQTSSGPAGWTRPVYTWRADEIIVDSHTVTLPTDLPDDVEVWVGMFWVDDPNVRVSLTVDGEEVPAGLLSLGRLSGMGR